MNRLDEAKRMCAEAADRKMAPPLCFQATLYSALLSGDEAEVKRQVDRIAAVPNLQSRFSEQKRLAAFQGRIRDGRELLAKQRAACRDCNPNAPELDTDLLLAEATAGRCDFVASDFAASRPPVRHEVVLGEAVMAAALCHDTKRTDAFTAELAKITDLDPAFKNDVYLPCLRALAAGTRDPLPTAITSYKVTRKEMPMGGISTLYCRGQIDLAQGKGADAAAEFQTLVDNPGWQVLGSLYVPAYAALGRAAETAGDAARSRNAFARFFQLWKAADPDLPMLVAAKQPSGGTPSQ